MPRSRTPFCASARVDVTYLVVDIDDKNRATGYSTAASIYFISRIWEDIIIVMLYSYGTASLKIYADDDDLFSTFPLSQSLF